MDEETKALFHAAFKRTLNEYFEEHGTPPRQFKPGFESMFRQIFTAGFNTGVQVKHDECTAQAWEAGYKARGVALSPDGAPD